MMLDYPRNWLLTLTFAFAATHLPNLTLNQTHAAEVVTILGTGQKGTSIDGSIARDSQAGEPYGVVIGPDKNLYVCEIATHMIRKVDLQTGKVERIAGSGVAGYAGDGDLAREALLNEPYEVRFDSQGNMVFVEMKNHLIRRVNMKSGRIETLAGNGTPGFSGDGGPAKNSQLNQPHSIALDENDNILICDIGNNRVRAISSRTGQIYTLIGGGTKEPLNAGVSSFDNLKLRGPRALDYAGNGVFALALREGNAIYQLDFRHKQLTHLGGTGKKGFSGEGSDARMAEFSGPKGVAINKAGDIYFADTESHTIRVIRHANGIVQTVVGNGTRGDGPDGNQPLNCLTNRPHGICVDDAGNVYIGDSENHRVRLLKVD